MTKKIQKIMDKIDARFDVAVEVNSYCKGAGAKEIYKFKDMQGEAFSMLEGMLHFGLVSPSDFEEAWDHVVSLGPKYDYHL